MILGEHRRARERPFCRRSRHCDIIATPCYPHRSAVWRVAWRACHIANVHQARCRSLRFGCLSRDSIRPNAIDHRHCVAPVNVRPHVHDGRRCLLFLPKPIYSSFAGSANGRVNHPDQGRRIVLKLLHGGTISHWPPPDSLACRMPTRPKTFRPVKSTSFRRLPRPHIGPVLDTEGLFDPVAFSKSLK